MTKYHNIKTVIDGITFDSKAEARRYGELILLEQEGEIVQLQVHKKYSLDVNGIHICNYFADFVYFDGVGYVVEDVKGVKTAVYMLKKKLMLAIYGIEVQAIYL